MLSRKFRGLQPWLQPYADYLLLVAEYNDLDPVVTSVYRSYARQAVLYERWKRGLSDIPAAPPGRSQHQQGLAFDLVVRKGGYRSDLQDALGAFWVSMGGVWNRPDPVHFGAPS